jgi:sortase A
VIEIVRHRLGTVILFIGLGVLAWSAVVYLWKDPFTSVYTAYEQRKLDRNLDRRFEQWGADPKPVTQPVRRPVGQRALANVRPQARRYRLESADGDAVGRLEVSRLDLNAVVVNGTSVEDLRRGPGRHLETAMPGEGQLVYIAGHRTTYAAPFSDIDKLQPGDKIVFELPYATMEYKVTGHRIVDNNDLSVLRSHGHEELVLQACHPRFFASQRYLVYARPVRVVPRTPPARG